MRTILHADLNNFYASVEQIYNSAYKDMFMAVSGSIVDRHGIILAKNQNAKTLGIKTGMTIKEAFDLCPSLVIVEAHFDRYLKYSKLVRKIFEKYTDYIEPFGLDEAWLDVTNSKIFGSGENIANLIREDIRKLGLTASVGVSYNKIFAKLGSDYKKPDAMTVISIDNYKDIVWKLPCADLMLVGRKTEQKLKKLNLLTIGDVARCDEKYLYKVFGKWGSYIYSFANGLDNSPVKKEDEKNEVKSIGNSMTSYRDLVDIEDVRVMFAVLCDSVSARLIDSDIGRATTLSINIRDEELSWLTRQTQLPYASMLSEDFQEAAMELFKQNYSFQKNIRSLGVSVSNFVKSEQLSIFATQNNNEKREKLAKTVLDIRKKFGGDSVRRAITLNDAKILRENPEETHTIHPQGYLKKP